jgi:hypothetical protein
MKIFKENNLSTKVKELGFLNHLNTNIGNKVTANGIQDSNPIIKKGVYYGNRNIEITKIGNLDTYIILSITKFERLKYKREYITSHEFICKFYLNELPDNYRGFINSKFNEFLK